ncbi:MAG: Holliday junction resolvase RuvX [Candidatus Cyclobacteriaceae bacterium M3_2C_046]
MGRILAIDYGLKRTGLAVTDPLQIIASPLDYVETSKLIDFLRSYMLNEPVESIVVGLARKYDQSDTDTTQPVLALIKKLKKIFPEQKIFVEDESFTSKEAVQAMIRAGMKKKVRAVKGNIDKISATIILQKFLENKRS